MIDQAFNYVESTVKEMTDLFEIRVENLKLTKDKKKSFAAACKSKEKKSLKKCKRTDYNSSVVQSSEESSVERQLNKKFYMLHGNHFTDKCKDLNAMINKHKQKNRRISSLMERAIKNWRL